MFDDMWMGSNAKSDETILKLAKGLKQNLDGWTVEDSCLVENAEWAIINEGTSTSSFDWVSTGIEIGDTLAKYNAAYYPRGAVGKNFIMKFEFDGYFGGCQLRMTNTSNFVFFHIEYNSGTGNVGFKGGFRLLGSNDQKINQLFEWNGTDPAQMVIKLIDDSVFALLKINGQIVWCDGFADSDLESLTGVKNGPSFGSLTGAGAGGSAIFNTFQFKPLRSYYNVVCLGDSNTIGSTDEDHNPGYHNLYPSLLNAEFLGSNIGFINAGVSGDETTDITARISTDLTARKNTGSGVENICLLLVGSNDFKDGEKTVSQTTTDLDSLIDAILLDGWTLAVMTYPPYEPEFDDDLADMNAWIRENADTLGYDVIDLHKDFTAPPTSGLRTDYFFAAEEGGYHYNAAGHSQIAKRVKEYLLASL